MLVAHKRERNRNGRIVDILVRQVGLKVGQRRVARRGEGHDLEAAIHQILAPQLAEHPPAQQANTLSNINNTCKEEKQTINDTGLVCCFFAPDRLHERRVHGFVMVLHVDPATQSAHNLLPLARVLHHNRAARLIVLCDTKLEHICEIDKKDEWVFKLRRIASSPSRVLMPNCSSMANSMGKPWQSITHRAHAYVSAYAKANDKRIAQRLTPSEAALDVMARLVCITRHGVLNRAGQNVAVMRQTGSKRRALRYVVSNLM